MLKGLRWRKTFGILPGVRINLSKSGPSASIGPRGADVNIGRHGVTTNAGIPGTGLSYRSKGGWLGVLAVVAGLGWWGVQHAEKIAQFFAPPPAAEAAQVRQAEAAAPVGAASTSLRYVHRNGSVLCDKPKTSGKTLKKESKGATVTLLEDMGGGWSKVQEGAATGYMRSSVLGPEPPQ